MGLERFTDRLAGNLSGGMKQKLGLSCTLVRSPELLLLDEPTVGVDPLSRRELWEILQEFVHEENLSVLVSTAYMNEAALCQKVYVLNKGQLLFSGTPDGLAEVARGRCYALESPKSSRPVSCRPSSSMTGTMWSMPCPRREGSFYPPGRRDWCSLSRKRGIKAEPVPSTLEDGFMILLKKRKKIPFPFPKLVDPLIRKRCPALGT